MENIFKKKDPLGDGKGESYMKQAEHIWSMLDEMSATDPEAYKLTILLKFI